ncbi:hypothetical protein IQ269_21015 [Tychonema sp. LEGE 07199]|uniref:hypothetical protein n=1 Tax=unclassified Tychonema TaxID=2642144 RepID=UPI00187F3EF0|nr:MULTISPECIES: hypothetical protein [unclassified Tychonema]MBE9123208.1 hypothetical protein [Tychonema sp. LEGE 07199]MBE9134877.1 hypothetical protein [Tychonema sp. LEGE 07196]
MKAKNFPQLALLSLVCVACVQNPLAQAPAASSAPNTPTSAPIQTPPISPPTQTPIAEEPAASPAPNTPTPTPIQTPPISPSTQTPVAQKTQIPTPIPTQTSLEVAQKTTNSLPPEQTYDLRVIDQQLWRRLTKITFGEDSIIVTMAITNGSKEVVILNGKDGMYLYDNYWQRYNLLPPSNNTQIMIKPGTTLKGQFVFVGWLQPKAHNLRIDSTINYSSNSITLFDNIPINR